jgi:hypothetical protein
MLDTQKLVPSPLNPKSDREIDDSSTLSLVLGYLVQSRLICGYLLQPRNRCLASFSTAIRIPEATPLKSKGKTIRRALCPRGVLIPCSRLNFLFFIEGPGLAESHSPLKLVVTFPAPLLDFLDFLTDREGFEKTCFFGIAPKRQ